MPSNLPIRCACGAVRGMFEGALPQSATYFVCYCRDCRAFAYFLGAEKRALDAAGGAPILQVRTPRISFSSGREKIACVRVTPKGVYRWFAACCRTPIANSPPLAAPPFLTLHACMITSDESPDAIGPVRGSVFAKSANGGGAGALHPPAGAITILAALSRMAMGLLAGDGRRSPFLDPISRELLARPIALSAEERAAVDARMDAAA